MQKDFDRWNQHKKAIHSNTAARVFFHPRELWFAHLGTNIGFEQDGRGDESLRPILVVRKFNNEVLWVLPLTRRNKPNNPYYVRLIDAKRLRYKIGTVPVDEFEDIKEKIRRLLA